MTSYSPRCLNNVFVTKSEDEDDVLLIITATTLVTLWLWHEYSILYFAILIKKYWAFIQWGVGRGCVGVGGGGCHEPDCLVLLLCRAGCGIWQTDPVITDSSIVYIAKPLFLLCFVFYLSHFFFSFCNVNMWTMCYKMGIWKDVR